MLEHILDKFNLLYLNEKEKTNYKAYDCILASEMKWSKDYDLKSSGHSKE